MSELPKQSQITQETAKTSVLETTPQRRYESVGYPHLDVIIREERQAKDRDKNELISEYYL